jgi:polyphenol oxidase
VSGAFSRMTLEILTSDLIEGARHGFFTRRGGASSGIYAGLNCGPGSSDQVNAVSVNRARVAEALGVPPARLLSLHQVHSAQVVVAGPEGWVERPRGDAAVTASPGIALSVLTADCAPVLFHDAEAGVIGAAHAGWRGALEGVLEETVAAMERLGARAGAIRAAVGPTIAQASYEVGPEFFERFAVEDRGYTRFFANGAGDRYRFDLPGFVLDRLRAAGVGEAVWIGECTYSDPARYYSYRRKMHTGEVDYGRLISAITL